MSEPIDRDITHLLARAFDLAWKQYYGPDADAHFQKELRGPRLLNS